MTLYPGVTDTGRAAREERAPCPHGCCQMADCSFFGCDPHPSREPFVPVWVWDSSRMPGRES